MIKEFTKVVLSGSKKGQRTVKRLSKLAKLQLDLKVEKEKRDQYYKEIGQHVHLDQVSDVMNSMKIRTLREQITQQEGKMKTIINQINRLKKIHICAHCGHAVQVDQRYCTRCSRVRK